ncbi:MAG: DUF1566 domain-containing protein [Saprospiraceae bacterium]
MQKIIVLFFLFIAISTKAQVGIGTTTPDGSAQLDVNSTSKGFLLPRMTFTQRNVIASPAPGLVVWCKNCTLYGEMQVYNGVAWTNMTGGAASSALAFGESGGGGIVAYILLPGDPGYDPNIQHGLIAASNNQTSSQWGCSGTFIPGAEGTAFGTGNQNTLDIVAGCATAGIAARVCNDLVLNGYSDWYLPSKDELYLLYQNIAGGFAQFPYWSSSEYDDTRAWNQDFSSGSQGLGFKNISYPVRAVRNF